VRLTLLAVSAFLVNTPAAFANWEHVNIRTVQETTLNTSESASFRRESLNAVSGLAVSASAPLIQQGQWNSTAQFSPTIPGGVFSLNLLSQPADPAPPNSYDALSSPSSGRSLRQAPNQFEGYLTPSGDLRAGQGSRASEVNLTASQTLTVF
jgi:hypothetical protein